MGCNESNLLNLSKLDQAQLVEKTPKKQGKHQRLKLSLENTSSEEYVLKSSCSQFTDEDLKMLEETFKKHFLFYKLSENQRREVIFNMEIYETPQGKIIFQKGDSAQLFFVIRSGEIEVEFNERTPKQNLKRGDYFGELALLYKAPRSATINTLEDSTFFCLSHKIFTKTIQEIIKKNFDNAKIQIEKADVFRYLSSKQKNLIAYHSYCLRYEKDNIIFKEGDDASSFFLVIRGTVGIKVPDKNLLIMKSGDSFGENCLGFDQQRGGTATALEKSEVLAISGSVLKKYLGRQLKDLSTYNIIRWSLSRHILFNWMSDLELEKIIAIAQLKKHKDNQIIFSACQIATCVVICLEKEINNQGVGSIFHCEYLLSENEADSRITVDLKKNGEGKVAKISFSRISKILGNDLSVLMKKPFPKSEILAMNESKKKYIEGLEFSDLTIKYKLGQGDMGEVFCVEDKFKRIYALKCISKKKIILNNLEQYLLSEKQILENIDFPFIVSLEKVFKDKNFVFFLQKYIDGGDFFHILRQLNTCNMFQAQFYFGCLVLSIEYLHSQNIIYRDLKPQNAVVDKKGFLNLIDLGTAKFLKDQNGYRTFTIIGTPHYMAPELTQGQGYTFSADIWALGVVFFQIVCGYLPFGNDLDDPFEIINEISQASEVQIPNNYENPSGRLLIHRLLTRDPIQRHVQNFVKIKNMSYFDNFNWEALHKKTFAPPFIIDREKFNIPFDETLHQYLQNVALQTGDPPESNNEKWKKIFQ